MALSIVKILKLLQILIISSLKFIFAPPISLEMGFRYFETVALTTAGGILGIFFFYHLSAWIIKWLRKLIIALRPVFWPGQIQAAEQTQIRKTIFTKKNRFIVRLRGRYGMFGIVALTPLLLSIPLGSFLAYKYYSGNRNILLYMSVSVMLWSFIFSTIYFIAF